jgi:hypothetical protein
MKILLITAAVLVIATWVYSADQEVLRDDGTQLLVFVTCTPANVAVFDARVHVKCVESFGGIRYFAVSTADSQKVGRYLSVFTGAILAGRPLSIRYDPDDSTSGPPIGCLPSDCRVAVAAAIL